MKIATSNRQAEESAGLLEDVEYTFENGPHMMQILSNLYTDPQTAMVREYLSNMLDAHTALYKATGSWGPKPLLVLPTSLSPVLKFCDNGIGMSVEFAKRIFTKYGKSTKNDSDDEVGGFGLGAKVAFAYNGGVDWTVETRQDGHKHTFIARIGTNDMAVLSHVASVPTKEPSGTTVSIPINRGDIAAIHKAALGLIPHFPIELDVHNLEGTPIAPTVLFQADDWKLCQESAWRHPTFTIVVGNVPYVVNDNQIRDILHSSNLTSALDFFLSNTFIITAPIGSVNIVPSRDHLMFTDKTKQYISTMCAKIITDAGTLATDTIASCATEYDAHIKYAAYTDIPYLNTVVSTLKYKGVELKMKDGIVRQLADLPGVRVEGYELKSENSAEIAEVDTTKGIQISLGDLTTILINDVPKGEVKIAKSLTDFLYVRRNASGRIPRWASHKMGKVYVVTTTLPHSKLSALLGGYPVGRMDLASNHSGIHIPGSKKLSAENIYRWSGTSWSARVNLPKDTDTKYYLPLTQNHSSRWNYNDSGERTRNTISNAEGISVEFSTWMGTNSVYGIRSSELSKFDSTWVNIETLIKNEIDNVFSVHGVEVANMYSDENYVQQYLGKISTMKEFNGINPMVDAFISLVTERKMSHDNIRNKLNLIRNILSPSELTGKKNTLPAPTSVLSDEYAKLIKLYPIFTLIIDIASTHSYGYGRTLPGFTPEQAAIIKATL